MLATTIRIAVLTVVISTGCHTLPSEEGTEDPFATLPHFTPVLPARQRDWQADLAVAPHAEFDGNHVRIQHVRDFVYQSDDEYVVNYLDQQYDLAALDTVDFLIVPFNNAPTLAHTMLSFGFADGRHLGVSVEARLEEGETYSPVAGALRQYELIYVLATERDLIGRRTKHRGADVYLYPTKATPAQARVLLVDILKRANKLAVEPEYYDTITNNCTTNIVRHINRLQPGRIPFDLRVLLPGYSDELAYHLGLLDTDDSFETAREAHRITERANAYAESEQFSQRIRR